MISSTTFDLGRLELSDEAARILRGADVSPETLFARHAAGDWGDVPAWLRADNERAAACDRDSHAIRSEYEIVGSRLLVITAVDRSHTRLMAAGEYTAREVGVREGYALWAACYERPNPLITAEEPALARYLTELPPVDSAIDVGTGTGRVARKLARLPARTVLGVDSTPEMLAVAVEHARAEGLANIRFEQAVLGESPLHAETGAFDLLTCCLMLCHVPGLKAAIAECARVVRPGGRLILTDFHPATAKFGWRADFVTPAARYLLPNMPNSRQDYLDGLRNAGCTILDVQDIALDGSPYGDLSEEAMRVRGWPPLCLTILAEKRA
jgi:ubiquinone/menaquinone biosynthesis C-methylase UbiE